MEFVPAPSPTRSRPPVTRRVGESGVVELAVEPLQKPIDRVPAVRVMPLRCSRTPVVSVPSSVVHAPTVTKPVGLAAVSTFVTGPEKVV